MKKISVSEGADPNYLATVIKCPELKIHPNADKLQLVTVFGNDVIVAKDMYLPGEKLVYFPVESCLSQKFLSWANLLDKPELNADGKTKGFFNHKHGRVRAIKLRDIPSQGFLFKVSQLVEYYEIEESMFNIGDTFDTVGSDLLVTKYIRKKPRSEDSKSKKTRVPKSIEKLINIFPKPIRKRIFKLINFFFIRNSEGIKSLIVDDFSQHYKTEHLGKNIHLVKPDDFITISAKMHGTSFYAGNIRCKKTFNPFLFIWDKLGCNIENTEYKFCYSSRSIIKNRKDGKFTDDVWGYIASEIHDIIPPNIKVYGEICGYTPSGKMIQKNYDYGVFKDNCELFVYRITYNLPDGNVHEKEWYEIEEFCLEHGLKTVPVYYNGLAKDLFPDVSVDDNWADNFLLKLKEEYLDKTCELCTTGVVNEGIVLRIENNPSKIALKFKSPNFLIHESSNRDNGEVDMEEES